MMLTVLATTIILSTTPCHNPAASGCYDYSDRTVRLNPHRITPYILTHELGHHVYFNQLTPEQRRAQAVNDPRVRNEEAWADVYAACVLDRGPRWMRVNGYRVRIGLRRFKRICRAVKADA